MKKWLMMLALISCAVSAQQDAEQYGDWAAGSMDMDSGVKAGVALTPDARDPNTMITLIQSGDNCNKSILGLVSIVEKSVSKDVTHPIELSAQIDNQEPVVMKGLASYNKDGWIQHLAYAENEPKVHRVIELMRKGDAIIFTTKIGAVNLASTGTLKGFGEAERQARMGCSMSEMVV